MIDFIRGQVQRVAESHVVVDVGGIGIRVEATPATVAELAGADIRQVPTSLVIREDSWTIYGFADTDERDVFDLVQTVSGVGPRTAQALVATLTPDGLRRAINQQDVTALMKVPGIGRKGAQRIILELTDRLGAPATPTEPSERVGSPETVSGVRQWSPALRRLAGPTARRSRRRVLSRPSYLTPPTLMAGWTWPRCCVRPCGN